jgi:hypothetical protein
MTSQDWPVYSAVAGFATVGLGCLTALCLQAAGYLRADVIPPSLQLRISNPGAQTAPAGRVPAESLAPRKTGPFNSTPLRTDTGVPQPQATVPGQMEVDERYYKALRSKMRWVPTTLGRVKVLTLDLDSRLLLAKSAARRAGLTALGLGFKDVYGIISAESSWVPRPGASKDGTPNLGIAQFEPATARALGIQDPEDPVEAVHAAAQHIKEAATWSADRIAGLKLDSDERAEKLREGISIYYNLSTRGRNAWTGRNTDKLPRQTQLHIQNARMGAQQAEFFDAQLQVMKYSPHGEREAVATSDSRRDDGI